MEERPRWRWHAAGWAPRQMSRGTAVGLIVVVRLGRARAKE